MSYVRFLPLYENLRDKVVEKISKGWVVPSREKVASVINQLETEQMFQIALLLVHYQFLIAPTSNPFTPENCDPAKRSKNKVSLPFGMKVSPGGKGLSVDMNLVPDPLVMLLAEYCSL